MIRKKCVLELEAHTSFTINVVGQLGLSGALLAKENRLHLTRSPRRRSRNKKIYEIHPSFNKRCHLAHDFRLSFSGPSRWRGLWRSWGRSRSWGISTRLIHLAWAWGNGSGYSRRLSKSQNCGAVVRA